ncbi:MAG: ABC transporter permease [Hyphomicrobiales bacterium]|nr:ABC transporter permease [Hyphomicrobiales bacterium]
MLLAVIANRAAMALVTLAGVAVVVFILLRVVPGDPVAMMISPGASAADIAALKAHYGLDAPLLVQFGIWTKGIVEGDFGTSITLHRHVTSVLADRLPATIELAVMALFVAVTLGGGIAIVGTLLRRTPGEAVIDGLNSVMLAVPDFIWALALVLLFAVALPVLPLTGQIDPALAEGFSTRFYLTESVLTGRFAVAGNILSHMIMPTLALALPLAAVIVRLLKQSLKEAMLQDYVLLARIKGFGELRLVLQEALRNAIGPTLALTGVQFTFLIGGTVIVERIFAYPGIGNLAIDAIINRDFPLIQGLVLLFGLIFILINIGIDLTVAALKPRLRHA